MRAVDCLLISKGLEPKTPMAQNTKTFFLSVQLWTSRASRTERKTEVTKVRRFAIKRIKRTANFTRFEMQRVDQPTSVSRLEPCRL